EGGRRVAAAAGQRDGVREELPQELGRVLLGAAVRDDAAPAGEDVPPGGAGRAGVGRDDLDAGLDDVLPGPDVLRVALTHDEHDDRLADDALVLARVPVPGDDPGVDEARDVALEREVHVVGLEAVRDGAALVPGGAVRRLPRDALAVLRLGPQLLGRVVARLGHGEPDERERRGLGGAVAARVAAAGPVDGDAGGDGSGR